ncbi:putative alpha/beta-hydrolase family hydrolase [Gordonia amarae]|nr:putative alpha/beta-hydrolase family hydrolase [Gordonia amarae]
MTVVAEVHRPDGAARGVVVLAHGAGGNRDAAILRAYAEELCSRGAFVARIDLPYRQQRPKGPPSPSKAAADRDGMREACEKFRGESDGPLIVGGHSYGGRQASMLVADDPDIADGLLLSSYPLHPPGKPERMRTEHLPNIIVPTLIVHGTRDPFATSDELAEAVALFTAPVEVVEVAAPHDLKPDKTGVAALTADAADTFLLLLHDRKAPSVSPAPRPHRTADLARVVCYSPDLDGDADPGEIVWTWVPYEDDPNQGKDRPVLVVGRDRRDDDPDHVLGLMLSSKGHRRDDEHWLAIGTGEWDAEHRDSYLRLDRVLLIVDDDIRREGAVLDERRFAAVANELRAHYGWR